jgi:sugar phosphate isomerase/epimerase
MPADLLLNTIALDPNRWTAEKQPFYRLADLLPAMAESGFDALVVWQYHLSTLDAAGVRDLKQAAEERDIRFPIVGLYPVLDAAGAEVRRRQKLVEEFMDRAAALGARVVKIFAGRLGSAEIDESGYRRSVACARAIAGAAADRGLALTAETHPDTLCDTVEACFHFLHDVAAPKLGLCYQPFDFADTARAVADYDRLRAHITHAHLQGRAGDRMSLLEDADLDYRALFRALAAHGFAGYLCIEFVEGCVVERPEDFDLQQVLANAVRDRAFIRKLAAEVGLVSEEGGV